MMTRRYKIKPTKFDKPNKEQSSFTKNTKVSKLKNLLTTLLQWGSKTFGWNNRLKELAPEYRDASELWLGRLSGLTNEKDIRKELEALKANRTWLMKVLSMRSEDRKKFLSTPPRGTFPFIQTLAAKSHNWTASDWRYWTTVLFSSRAIQLSGIPSHSTIEQAKLIKPTPSLSRAMKGFWRQLGFGRKFKDIPRRLLWPGYHLTTKVGPNGPAMATLLRDYYSLTDSQLESLRILGGPKFAVELDKFYWNRIYWGSAGMPWASGISRRLHVFGDKEGKTREIAILDYFSQSVLRQLHLYLFRILKNIPQDVTFDQRSFKEKMKHWEGEIFSCDLSAATDNFPISVQSDLLKVVLPDHYVDAWKNIMVGTAFDYKGSKLIYNPGNPMGAYSSWAVFALAHHLVMYFCCTQLRIPWKDAKYVLLGDDILIGDRRLYKVYRNVISSLGIPVSDAKTFESYTLWEFAKRWGYKGDEITPFPLPALNQFKTQWWGLANLIQEETVRGHIPLNGVPIAVTDFLKLSAISNNKGIRSRSYYKDIESKVEVFLAIIRLLRHSNTPEESLNKVLQSYSDMPGFFSPVISFEFIRKHLIAALGQSILQYAMDDNEVLHRPSSLSRTYRETLGDKGPYLFTRSPWEEISFNIITKWKIFLNRVDYWGVPMLLKAVVLPKINTLFIGRTRDILIMAQARLTNKVIRDLKKVDPTEPIDKTVYRLTGVPYMVLLQEGPQWVPPDNAEELKQFNSVDPENPEPLQDLDAEGIW